MKDFVKAVIYHAFRSNFTKQPRYNLFNLPSYCHFIVFDFDAENDYRNIKVILKAHRIYTKLYGENVLTSFIRFFHEEIHLKNLPGLQTKK
jgi:hypothetical protein